MKCYTVIGERVLVGLKIQRNDAGEPVLKIGTGKHKSELPVGKGVQEMFEGRTQTIAAFTQALARLEAGEEGADEDLREMAVEVSGEDFIDFNYVGFAKEWEVMNPSMMVLGKADLSTNEPWRIIKERRKDDTALVHFVMESPGQQDLYANVPDEFLAECRHPYVMKSYRPFPPAGVLVAAIGTGPREEQQGLLLMYPRSSFRIHRDEEPPALVVAWPGSTLKCFAPAKYRPATKQKGRKRGRVA